MRAFKEPKISNNWKCLICNTNAIKKTVLIKIRGTKDGNITECEQFHLDCINLTYYKDSGIIAQVVK